MYNPKLFEEMEVVSPVKNIDSPETLEKFALRMGLEDANEKGKKGKKGKKKALKSVAAKKE